MKEKTQEEKQDNPSNPLLNVPQYDEIDSYWSSLLPDARTSNDPSYHDGLRQPDGSFPNVFCGPIDELLVRYEQPAYYLNIITGCKYEITGERNRIVSPNGRRINPDIQAWYRFDAPEEAKRISPENPYAPLVAFSREYLRTSKKLIEEGLKFRGERFEERLKEELKEFTKKMGLQVIN